MTEAAATTVPSTTIESKSKSKGNGAIIILVISALCGYSVYYCNRCKSAQQQTSSAEVYLCNLVSPLQRFLEFNKETQLKQEVKKVEEDKSESDSNEDKEENYSWSLKNLKLKKVERVKWAPNRPFANEMVNMREPFILTNTVVTQWKALELWQNQDYLANHPALNKMTEVQGGPEKTFGFIDNKTALAKAQLKGINLITSYNNYNMSSKEFFDKINDSSDKNYYYWYGKVQGTLTNDVQPNDFIWADIDDKDNFGLYMWLSNADVRPPIHYDMDHNFFVHISGVKRFVLYPPWEWKKMYPFPRIHPRWHKSQCSFDSPDLSLVPNYAKAIGYEAVLNAGDVLYVPPYWWHHVQSVTASVSLASWSRSGTHDVMSAVYQRTNEFDRIDDINTKIAAVKLYIEMLLERMYGSEGVQTFIDSMMDSRWSPLQNIFLELPQYQSSTPVDTFCTWDKNFDVNYHKKKFEDDVSYASQRFKNCQFRAGVDIPDEKKSNRRDHKAITALEIADFIEIILSDVIGAENVFGFLKFCLQEKF